MRAEEELGGLILTCLIALFATGKTEPRVVPMMPTRYKGHELVRQGFGVEGLRVQTAS